jgi:glycosyltransferase involved in cell wall biosynthesis
LRHRAPPRFSQKSLLVLALAKLFRTKVLLKLTSAGQDDPGAIRMRSAWRYRWYRQADLFIGVSPRLHRLYEEARLPSQRFRLIPNGVDARRFRPPADPEERAEARRALGLDARARWALCVGFFSPEKHPDAVYGAWSALRLAGRPVGGLVFIGATQPTYHEIDLVERTDCIEAYYRAADVFLLASSREGLPNALLEAMASGLPCIASHLEGVTDTVITDGVNGLLVPPADTAALAQAWERLIDDPELARRLGAAARVVIEARYGIAAVSDAYAEAYRSLVHGAPRR